MARNLFTYALLGGIAEGAGAYAKGMSEERRMQQELEMRKALQDDQQAAMMERMGYGGRIPGVPGAAGARVAAPAMSAAQAVADANTLSAVKDEELISGDFVPPSANRTMAPGYTQDEVYDPRDAAVRKTYGPDGQPLAEGEKPKMVLDRNDPLVKDGLTRLKDLRERIYGGKPLAEAKQIQTESNLLERAGSGDRPAGEGLLYAKGKDPQETVARAEAQEAKADKDRRTNPNLRAGSGKAAPGEKPPTGVDLQRSADAAANMLAAELGSTRQKVNEEYQYRLKKGTLTADHKALYARWKEAADRVASMSRKPGESGPAPAQSGNPRLVWDPTTKTFKPKA